MTTLNKTSLGKNFTYKPTKFTTAKGSSSDYIKNRAINSLPLRRF